MYPRLLTTVDDNMADVRKTIKKRKPTKVKMFPDEADEHPNYLMRNILKQTLAQNGNHTLTATQQTQTEPKVKRGRGRPRKYPIPETNFSFPGSKIQLGSYSEGNSPVGKARSVSSSSSLGFNNYRSDEMDNLSDSDYSNSSSFIESQTPERSVRGHKPKKTHSRKPSDKCPKEKKTYHYEPVLPPCRVCGSKASGYHFGAITCEACKVFFRRSLNRQTSYHCSSGGACKILPNRRISCSFCRLQKCLKLGMSRDGIQRGRYTVERKTECIRKVKELEIGLVRDTDSESEEELPQVKQEPMEDDGPDYNEELVRDIMEADTKTIMITRDETKELINIQAKYIDYIRARESVFGHLQALDPDEYREIYNKTGLDVDNRRKKYANCVLSFVTKVTKFIQFAKLLPGFIDLDLSDQITLLREGLIDWILLSGFEMFNAEHMVFTCSSCHATYSRNDFHGVRDSRFYYQCFIAAGILKKLMLRPDELALVKALVVFSPDGSEGQVKDIRAVEKLQHQIVDALLQLIRRNRNFSDSKAAVFFGTIVHGLTELRTTAQRYKQLFDECLKMFPDLEYPELLVEILGDEIKCKVDSLRESCPGDNNNDKMNLQLSWSPASCDLSGSPSPCPEPQDLSTTWLDDSNASIYEETTSFNCLPNTDCILTSDRTVMSDTDDLLASEDMGTDRVLLLAQL